MAHVTSKNHISPAIGSTYSTWFLGRKRKGCEDQSRGIHAVCRTDKGSWFLGRKHL